MKSKRKTPSIKELNHIDQYRALYESANDSIFLMSKEKFLSCNPKALEMFGCKEDDIIGYSPIKFSPEKQPDGSLSSEKVFEKINPVVEGEPQRFEWLHKKYDGSTFYAEVSLNRIVLNEETFIQAIVRDITERKKADERIRKSEESYRLLIESTNEGYWRIDNHHKTIDVNDSLCKMLGYKKGEMIGKTPFDFVDNENRKIFKNQVSYRDKSKHRSYEIVLQHKDGTNIHTLFNATTIRNKVGKPNGSFAFIKNFTERKEIEKRLIEQKASFENIFNNAIDAIYVQSLDGTFIDVNNAVKEMYGYTKEEMIGKSPEIVSAPGMNDLEKVAEYTNKAAQGYPQRFEFWGKRKNGEIFLKDVRQSTGEYFGEKVVFAFAIDISKRKLAEEKLKESEEKFRRIIRELDVGFYSSTIGGQLLDYNKSFCKMLGLDTGKDHKNSNLPDFWLHIEDRKKYMENLLNKKSIKNYSILAKKKNGQKIVLQVNAHLLKNKDGRRIGIEGTISDITEQKEATEAILNKEKQYRTLFNFSPNGILLEDATGTIIDINPAFSELMGYSKEELIGKKVNILTHPDQQKDVAFNIQQLLDGKVLHHIERSVKKDGSIAYMQLSERSFSLPDGRKGIICIANDITERKIAEEALQQSEEKYRMLVENQTDLVVKVNTNGEFLYVSPSYCKLFDKTEEELIGQKYLPLVHEDDREETEKAMQSLNSPPYSIYVQQRALTKNGWRWLEWMDTAVLNKNNKVLEIIGVGRDITEQKNAEAALKDSEARYKGLFLHAPVGIVTFDLKGNPINANNKSLEILGSPSDSKTSQINIFKYQPLIEAGFTSDYQKCIKTGVVFRAEKFYKTYWGKEVYLRYIITPIHGKDNKTVGVQCLLEDITQRKLAEEALKESEYQLRESQKVANLGSYVYNLSIGTWKSSPTLNTIFGIDANYKTDFDGWVQIVHPEDQKMMADYFMNNILKNHEFFNKEYRILRINDQKKRWVHGLGELEFDTNGNVAKMIGTIQDITERKLVERSLMESEEQLRQLTIYMDSKTEEEKKRIGREIHDGLGQLLTGLKMDLQWISKKWPEESAILKNKFKSMNNIIDTSVKEVQKLSIQLRPKMLDELGLLETIQWEADQFEERTGIYCNVQFSPEEFEVEHERSSTIYRVLMELLTNVYRHAKATKVGIQLIMNEDNYTLTFIDNGIGIEQEKIDSKFSFGLISISERINMWDGSFKITSKKNKGTTIEVVIPY